MRYRVKVTNLKQITNNNLTELVNSDDSDLEVQDEGQISARTNSLTSNNNKPKYLIQNWQFEIRKLTYEDAGVYQCLLPLVNPIFKNVTLQVMRKYFFCFNESYLEKKK